MIAVSGDSATARTATWMRESRAIRTSTSAPFGFASSISATACWPSVARPTMSNPWRSRISETAASIAGWSSATTMVVATVMLREARMAEPLDILLSTLLSLPDDRRAAVERLLVPLARSAALGELAADVAHDVANPLFGAIGLVDLLLEDAAPASEEAARLQLLQQTTLEMKGTLQVLLD